MWDQVRFLGAVWIATIAFVDLAFVRNASCDENLPVVITSDNGQTFRLVGPTQFMMGARENRRFRKDHSEFNTAGDDRPVHPVVLTQPIYVATTEVTVGQFKRFVKATGHKTTAESSGIGIVGFDPLDDEKRERPIRSFLEDPKYTWRSPGFVQDDSHPVVGVSYHDAQQYCDWLSSQDGATYRLPTEAEWECACRAGTTTPFSFGTEYRGVVHKYANLGNVELEKAFRKRVLLQWLVDLDKDPGDGNVFTAPVGSYAANPWGLHDLHGNVWEWCQDNYLDTSYRQFKAPGYRKVQPRSVDPLCTERWHEDGDWRVIRGGSWFVSPVQCQSGVRGYFEADDAACYLGFRVVREASEKQQSAATRIHELSDAAAKALDQVARAKMEAHPGVVRWEIDCESITPTTLSVLADYQYPVEIDLRPPGNLTAAMVAQIAAAPNLRGVVFRSGGPGVDEATFEPLTRHRQLRWVQITGTGDLGNELVGQFANASELRSVHFQGTEITDSGLEQLPRLAHLETVHLATTQSTGRFLENHIGSPLREASFSRVDDSGAAVLARFSNLRQLNLGASPISKTGLESLSQLRKVSSFTLRGNQTLADADYQSLARFRLLERLNLEETNAGDLAVAACRELNHLHAVNLNSILLTNRGLKGLSELASLRDLSIGPLASQVTDAGLSDLWRLANLNSLHLNVHQLTGSGFGVLAELPKLRTLTLSSPALTDEALFHVSKIPNLNRLTIGGWDAKPTKPFSLEALLALAKIESLESLRLIVDEANWDDAAEERLRELRPGLKVEVQR